MAPGDKLRQSELMLRAAAQGQGAVQNAHSELMGQYRANAQGANQLAGIAGGAVQDTLNRNEQSRQFDERMGLERSALNLKAADLGLERKGGKGDDRLSKLDQEMERGAGQPTVGPLETEAQNRLRMNAGEPLEQNTSSGEWGPTTRRQQMEDRSMALQEEKAATERMRTMVWREQVAISYNKAKLMGDREKAELAYQTSLKPVNQMAATYNSIMSGKPTEIQWARLMADSADAVKADPTLGEAIKEVKSGKPDRQVGKNGETAAQRLLMHMRGQMDHAAMDHILNTGRTDGLEIDWGSPKMLTFKEMYGHAQSLAKQMGPEFSQFLMIESIADKNEFLNKQAAIFTKYGMDQVLKADLSGEGLITGNEYGGLPQGGAQEGGGEPMGSLGPPPNQEEQAYRQMQQQRDVQKSNQMMNAQSDEEMGRAVYGAGGASLRRRP